MATEIRVIKGQRYAVHRRYCPRIHKSSHQPAMKLVPLIRGTHRAIQRGARAEQARFYGEGDFFDRILAKLREKK